VNEQTHPTNTTSSALPAASDLLNPKQTAAYLHVAVATLADWRYRGSGPLFIRAGRRILYRRAALDAWLEANTYTRTDLKAA